MDKNEAINRIEQIISYGHNCYSEENSYHPLTKEIRDFKQKIYNLAEVYFGVPNRFCTLLDNRIKLTGSTLQMRKIIVDYYMSIAESLKERIEMQNDEEVKNNNEVLFSKNPKKIFVVHGRNEKMRSDIFQFLRCLSLEPIEWTEALALTKVSTPYIGEILDAAFSNAQAIVVLLTPDDQVKLRDELQKPDDLNDEKEYRYQARPNVLFEAGMAVARNEKRTIIVNLGNVKKFSDIGGKHILYLNNTPEQRQIFIQKLSIAGCKLDKSGTDWLSVGNFD